MNLQEQIQNEIENLEKRKKIYQAVKENLVNIKFTTQSSDSFYMSADSNYVDINSPTREEAKLIVEGTPDLQWESSTPEFFLCYTAKESNFDGRKLRLWAVKG
jgi:hypothetical protein